METIEKSIEVDAPIAKVYNQWTQFEGFPKFMEGVEQVTQLDEKHLHWVAQIGGKKKEWDTEILEQIPDKRIAWRSTTGGFNFGLVLFQRTDESHSKVTLQINYEPKGLAENVADSPGVLSRKVEADLKRFRTFIQKRITETGGWRGEIRGQELKSEPDYDASGKSGLS